MKKILAVVLVLLPVWILCGDNNDYTAWWIDKHGDYARAGGQNDPRTLLAFDVFERLKRAADTTAARPPRLYIIETRGNPYALSLMDGGIIINPTTLEFCYGTPGNIDRQKGDIRLAFIVGHEMAHLANNDFNHKEAFQDVRERGSRMAQKEFARYSGESMAEMRKKELLADKDGAIFAAMAGYRVSELFWKKNDFLAYWARQVGIGRYYDRDPAYPSPSNRLHVIRANLKAVTQRIELFKSGVLFYQKESYRDAADAFREFARKYPAREVYNNIGACYLGLALQRICHDYSDDYFRFRLSVSIDDTTTAKSLRPRSEKDYLTDKYIYKHLNKAAKYFELAVRKDSADKNSRYNFAAALIWLRNYAGALSVCNELLNENPGDVLALNNKAVAFYLYGKEEDLETINGSMELLQRAHRSAPGNCEVLYNLGTLKMERERLAGAKLYWDKYLNLPVTPKDKYFERICKKLNRKLPAVPAPTASPPPVPEGIRFDGDDYIKIQKKWGKKYTFKSQLGSEENSGSGGLLIPLEVMVKGNIRVLALDGQVELVEKQLNTRQASKELLQALGPPQKVVHHTRGNFYVYKDMGFSFREINGIVCSYIWYAKGL